MAKKQNTQVVTQDMAKEIEDLRARLLAPTGNKIKIENKSFTLPNGETSDHLDLVIVDFVYANKYYEGAYDSNKINPPTCFAINALPNELSPSSNSPDTQSQTGCFACPMNQFGTNGKGKACQNRILAAVLPADAVADTPFFILDISPTGLKGFSAYVSALARSLGRPPYGVITHVECNPSVKWDVPIFNGPQAVEDVEFITMVRARLGEARELLMTEPDIAAMHAANDAKPKAKAKPLLRKAAGRR